MAPTVKQDQDLITALHDDMSENSLRGGQPNDQPWYGPDSTGGSLLEHIETLPDWAGDDFEECLEVVIRTRGEARF